MQVQVSCTKVLACCLSDRGLSSFLPGNVKKPILRNGFSLFLLGFCSNGRSVSQKMFSSTTPLCRLIYELRSILLLHISLCSTWRTGTYGSVFSSGIGLRNNGLEWASAHTSKESFQYYAIRTADQMQHKNAKQRNLSEDRFKCYLTARQSRSVCSEFAPLQVQ